MAGMSKKPSLGSKYKPLKGKPGDKKKMAGKKPINPPFKPTTRPAKRGK